MEEVKENIFKVGDELVPKENNPYPFKEGLFRVSRVINDNLMVLHIKEHKDKKLVGRTFKARPEFFKKKELI